MAITVPPVRGAGDLGHVDDSNVVRQALLDLDTADAAHISAKGDVHGFRWDETVGRRLFAWDAVNGREQLVYGDTGQRVVSLINGWTGSFVTLRRIGNTVHFNLGHDGSAASKTSTSFFQVPAGFRPAESNYAQLGVVCNAGAFKPLQFNSPAGGYLICDAGPGEVLGFASWVTNESWPASLPGSASGSIPTGLAVDTAELLPAEGS